jgi:hypothetical protein
MEVLLQLQQVLNQVLEAAEQQKVVNGMLGL